MDRECRRPSLRPVGIPHPRGDGPGILSSSRSPASYSPPAWGWTGTEADSRLCLTVFPTRVGMDRSDDQRKHETHGIPHPRGDGPHLANAFVPSMRYSPPAWGWTVVLVLELVICDVFPTRVGMDRRLSRIHRLPQRIPHPRGDGPLRMARSLDLRVYSPPAWGWTASDPHPTRQGCVFPTRVGMDRNQQRIGTIECSIPHPRGDGPPLRACFRTGRSYSPPAWGWTERQAALRTRQPVFPTRWGWTAYFAK
ncbi:MAG: hypothetical protein E1N59_2990 [Puniceicoccaceae bacterium 5H]|nr:MAG: hypothetical protein E1N59_2990 [Puniceicoccaceae bacterium 5H]